jgi:hypothetical protein
MAFNVPPRPNPLISRSRPIDFVKPDFAQSATTLTTFTTLITLVVKESSVMEAYFQQQSAFFKLPRELREKIYEHYVYEEYGLVYDFENSRMRRLISGTDVGQQNSLPTNYDLANTCKIAADELQGISFRVNSLTFTTGESPNGTTHQGVSSLAGRWRCSKYALRSWGIDSSWADLLVLLYIHKTRISIVLHAAELITPNIIDQIEDRYPTLGIHFRSRLHSARRTPLPERTWNYFTGSSDNQRDGISLASFEQALEYLIELLLAEDGDRFHQLASHALGRQIGVIKSLRPPWRGLFVTEALPKLLAFKIVPWCIPSDEDLCRWEALLTEPTSCQELKEWVNQHPKEWFDQEIHLYLESRPFRWFFSAMASFIDFRKYSPSVSQW